MTPYEIAFGTRARERSSTPPPEVTLRVGDCRHELASLEEDSIHLVVTDPPQTLVGMGSAAAHADHPPSRYDPVLALELQRLMSDVGRHLSRVMLPGSFALVFSRPHLQHRMAVGLGEAGLEVHDQYVWIHLQSRMGSSRMRDIVQQEIADAEDRARLQKETSGLRTPNLNPDFESIIVARKPTRDPVVANWDKHHVGLINSREYLVKLMPEAPSTVMFAEKDVKLQERYGRSSISLRLMSHLIRLFSMPGQVVLDPFVGGNSTALAAWHNQRSFIGMDINPENMDIARKRLMDSGWSDDENKNHG